MKFVPGALRLWWYKQLATAFKGNPVGRFFATQSFDNTAPHPYDYPTHLKVYSINVYAYASMRAIARDVSSTPLLVQKQERQDGDLVWKTQTSGALFDLLAMPNPNEAWDQLSERWLLGLLGTGNGYLTLEDKKELWYIKPDWIHIKTVAGQLDGYVARHKGLLQRFKLDEIVHIKLADPAGEYYGMPPSKVITKSIMTKISQNDYIRNYFKKGGIPGMVLSTEKSLKPDQLTILRKEFDAAYGGEQSNFGVMVFSDGLKSERIPPDIKSLMPNELDLMVMREVLAAYGVPPVKIGVLEGATYANALEQDRIYQHDTVEPIRRMIENAINMQIARIHFPGWRVLYDRTEVAGLNENAEARSLRVDREWRGGLLKRNEARLLLGYEELEEGEGGDEFWSSGGGGGFALEGESLGEPVENRALPAGTKIAETPRYRLWKAFDVRANKKARILRAVINKFFDGQLERLLEAIEKATGNGKLMLRLGLYTLKDGDIPDGMKDIFDQSVENRILIETIAAVFESLGEQAGQEALDTFRIDFQFNVQDPEFEAVLAQLKNKITRINASTAKDVKKIIGESFDLGESLDELAGKLQTKFKTFSKIRSKVIARTEIARLSNAAAQGAYGQAGVAKKEWVSVQDGNVRDQHLPPTDGEIVDLDKPFIMSGDALMYPSDPNGAPENTINCRCVSVPIVEV